MNINSILKVIDTISKWSGYIGCWACVALVVATVWEVTARYVFNKPTIWAADVMTMLLCTIVVIGLAYTHLVKRHIRIDAIYQYFSPRGKAIIDVIGALVFLFPLVIMLAITAVSQTMFSLRMGEKSELSYFYPPVAPIKAVIFLGLFLFGLQAIAQFWRDLYLLVKNKPYD